MNSDSESALAGACAGHRRRPCRPRPRSRRHPARRARRDPHRDRLWPGRGRHQWGRRRQDLHSQGPPLLQPAHLPRQRSPDGGGARRILAARSRPRGKILARPSHTRPAAQAHVLDRRSRHRRSSFDRACDRQNTLRRLDLSRVSAGRSQRPPQIHQRPFRRRQRRTLPIISHRKSISSSMAARARRASSRPSSRRAKTAR